MKQQSWLRDLICGLCNLELDNRWYARVSSKWRLKLFCRNVSFQYGGDHAFKRCTALSTLRTVLGSTREDWTAIPSFSARLWTELSSQLHAELSAVQPIRGCSCCKHNASRGDCQCDHVAPCKSQNTVVAECDAPSAFRRHRPSHSTPWFLVTPHWVEHTRLWLEVTSLLTGCPHATRNTRR